MKIRSVTCFSTVGPTDRHADAVRAAGRFAREIKGALESAGFPVQTLRLATQPLSHLPGNPLGLASELWPQCADAGFEYLSLGPVLADAPNADLSRLDQIPDLIRATDAVFASVLVARKGQGLHMGAIQRTAEIVRDIAHTTDLGFGNLRLAMLANVGPHVPFFPAAYHDGGPPTMAIATESADLAVAAFAGPGSLDEVRARLSATVEVAALQDVVFGHPID